MNKEVLIGIDGGGTHTRVLICDLQGNKLTYVERGSASLHKDKDAALNVQSAIADALSQAGRSAEDVQFLAAGIAGYDSPDDLSRVVQLTDLPGLTCPKLHVNDAVAAHAGALLTKHGIIAISGTGSIILGITETGRQIRNYDFHHYAASAARFLAYNAVFELLAGNRDATDDRLLQSMLIHWNAATMQDMVELARRGFAEDRRIRDKKFGDFAPVVTAAAVGGSSVAMLVCDRAAEQLKTGIELIAAAFAEKEVQVAFIGSVIASPYVSRELTRLLQHGRNKRYRISEPRLAPVAGSILLAQRELGIALQLDRISYPL